MKSTENFNGYSSRGKTRRKRNYSLVILTGFTVIVIIFAVLSFTLLFPVKTVKITGSSVYSPADINTAAGLKDGQQILTAPADSIKNVILDSFIYIDEVNVKKKFPDTIEIEVVPSKPIANITVANEDETESYLYISGGGKILEISDVPKRNVPILTGVKFSPAVVPGVTVDLNAKLTDLTAEQIADIEAAAFILDVADEIKSASLEKIDYIDISDPGNIKIMYDNRINMQMGGLSDFAYKLSFLKEIIDTKIGPNTSGRLSMLSTGGASFIDSDGLSYNEKKFEQNIASSTAALETEITEVSEETAEEVTEE
ncbi:MAG: FtsQ-type POTRA domain-containing protein [Ruminococcus sp.]|jgi:cell division septal protein FtsQ|nr:FtsQ-type POTRA domain-containing protein [Ruminococcus sp.]